VSRSSKAVKGKRKVEAKRARPAVKRRAVPERIRSEEVAHGVVNYGTNESHDNAGEAVALATNDVSQMNMARAAALYPQATATALAALQAWFLLPLRNLQSWQEAWFRLMPR
jgi:hypothetical protein